MKFRNQKCAKCAIYNPNAKVCALTNRQVNPEEDYCSQYRSALNFCCVCGSGLLAPIWRDDEGNGVYKAYCEKCANR